MKYDLYYWPINQQAWVLSWGLRDTMRNMGVLNKWGNIEDWTNPGKIPKLLDTSADVILFVGFEHFRKKIPSRKIKHKKAKIACWLYESVTDPYGAASWNASFDKHFMKNVKEFNSGFTKVKDENLDYFDCMDVLFCADELDYERFKSLGRKAFWLPFGVDPNMFSPDGRLAAQEKNVKVDYTIPRKSLVDQARIKYGTRYGIKSGRSRPAASLDVRSAKLLPGKRYMPTGAFIGTRSNVRIRLLDRIGMDITTFQTPRKGDFGQYEKAIEHTKNLVRSYNSFLISINLRSIFSGVTPRAVESMACGRLLFQYLCAPNRPMSRKMLNNCVKYEVLTQNGLKGFKEKYRYYLDHPAEAIAIGRNAREEILHGHTLRHRVLTMNTKLSTVRKQVTTAQPSKKKREPEENTKETKESK